MYKSQFKFAIAGSLILFFFVVSCTKIDTTTLGKDLIPAVDNIHTFDTSLSVIANNFDNLGECDSVSRNDLHALGIISNDPLFGKTAANIYVEFKPLAYPFTFPDHDNDSIIIDSVVMVLNYGDSFGDSTVMQKVNVYPLTFNFNPDSIYKTCNILDYKPILLGTKTYFPYELNDSIHSFRENATNQLRIPLDKSNAQAWALDPSITASDSAFKANFKGYAIVSDEGFGGQALNYFGLNSASTRVSIYVRTSKANVKDTSVMEFPMGSYSGQANSIVRSRNNSEITQHLSQPPAGDEDIYIQTSPGNYGEIKIPGLTGLSNRVIHRAELIMDQEYSNTTFDQYFNVPNRLFLDTQDSSGSYIPIPCDINATEAQSGFSTFGGRAKSATDAGGNSISRYTFNITRYVQNLVTNPGNINGKLRLRAPYYISYFKGYTDRCNQFIAPFALGINVIANGRVKLSGTNNRPSAMRLHIVYSTL
ncbi:MAG: DUF4270 family protein [Ginsengibacter sp.]